jgi:hypothetical protein
MTTENENSTTAHTDDHMADAPPTDYKGKGKAVETAPPAEETEEEEESSSEEEGDEEELVSRPHILDWSSRCKIEFERREANDVICFEIGSR